jgi:hypothetical protein
MVSRVTLGVCHIFQMPQEAGYDTLGSWLRVGNGVAVASCIMSDDMIYIFGGGG